MKDLVLLKLGGSIITDKSSDDECVVDHHRLKRISREIAKGDRKLVIVHGAGSCGHPQAKRYRLNEHLNPETVPGIHITHEAVASLNREVVAELREAGIEAVGIHPFTISTAKGGRIQSINTDIIKMLLKYGITPVLHGDVVMDTERGACIISGDQIINYLARELGIARVGLATNVPGIMQKGEVVRLITRDSLNDLDIGGSSETDVTGGMKGKITEMLQLAENGTESAIFGESMILEFLEGKDHGGTIVR